MWQKPGRNQVVTKVFLPLYLQCRLCAWSACCNPLLGWWGRPKASRKLHARQNKWRGWGLGQKSSVGWICTAEAYCRNVNLLNVLQLEEEQDHRLNWAFREKAEIVKSEQDEQVKVEKKNIENMKMRGERNKSTQQKLLYVCVFFHLVYR